MAGETLLAPIVLLAVVLGIVGLASHCEARLQRGSSVRLATSEGGICFTRRIAYARPIQVGWRWWVIEDYAPTCLNAPVRTIHRGWSPTQGAARRCAQRPLEETLGRQIIP